MHFYLTASATLKVALLYQDTQIFVDAAQRLFAGGKLYPLIEPLYVTYAPGMAVFKFSPLYILPYVPWLDAIKGPTRDLIYSGFYAVHILRYCLAGLLLFWFFGPRKNPAWTSAIIITFGLASPVFECLNGMTFENLLFFSLVLAMFCLSRQWTWIAAAILSYVMLAKLYPVIFCLYFLTRQRWPTLLKIAITGVVWMMISILVIGIDSHADYYIKILPILLHEEANIGPINVSLVYTLLSNEPLRKAALIAILSASIAIINFSEKNKKNSFKSGDHYSTDISFSMDFAFITTTLLLLLKNSWVPYQIILLIPITLLITSSLTKHGAARIIRIVLALLAFIPLLESRHYPTLQLGYYSWLLEQPWFGHVSALLNTGRLYISGLLWLGTGSLLLWDASSRQDIYQENTLT